MIYTVYQTTNLVNGKIYVGVHKTSDPNDAYLGSGKVLKQAIAKYGRHQFEKSVLFCFNTIEEAYQKEAEIVNKEFVLRENTYNQVSGGVTTVDWSSERKLHYSQRLKGENHPQWGKPRSEETKRKQSASLIGRKMSRSSVDRSAAARRGRKSSLKGKPQTKESNHKRSIAHLAQEKLTCPHCSKQVSPQNAKRWHFDRCKPRKPRLSMDRLACGWGEFLEKPNDA